MRRRHFLTTLPAAMAALSGCQTLPSLPRRRVRILSYNIHHGAGMDGVLDLPRIAGVILEAAPDVVALQEVDDRTQRSGGIAQAEELGRLTGMHSVFGKALSLQGGGYGLALLSRSPFLETTTHPLPSTPGRETRAALAGWTRIQPQYPAMQFVCTHLDHTRDDTDRRQQVHRLNTLFAQDEPHPVVLMGDFNATPDEAAMGPLWGRWRDAAGDQEQGTIPVDHPTRRIDYLLLRPPARWHVVDYAVIPELVASDHRPVVATLEWIGN